MATPRSNEDKDGKTKVEQDGDSAPRLPHERDESSDSQQHPGGEATEVGKQAHADVKRGMVDTSKGEETDRVYNDEFKR